MKRYLILMLCLTLTIGAANAQKKYSDVKAEGKALFDKKDYAGALKRFEYAKYKSIDRKDHIIDPELKRMMTVCQTKVSRKKTTGGATPTRTSSSSTTTREPKAKIEDFKVYNGEHNGELGVRIKCSFYAYNMQGRSGRVKCTFSLNNRTLAYDDGNPEYMDYVEYREVCVSDMFDVESNDEYKSVELHIPYAAFRLAEFYEQEFKAHLEIYDDNASEAEGDPPMAKSDKWFTAIPVSVYVDDSKNSKEIDAPATGGYSNHTVRTGGEPYYFDGLPDWIRIENQTPTSFKLLVEENYSTEIRSCNFNVHVGNANSGSNKVRFFINQAGGSGAQGAVATITNARNITHNMVGGNGVKYMQVCPRITVNGMRGEKIYLFLYFYQDDNETPLLDENGDQVLVYDMEVAPYDNCDWTEWCIRIANNAFLLAPNATSQLSFDLVVKDDNGNVLARENNIRVQGKN